MVRIDSEESRSFLLATVYTCLYKYIPTIEQA